jgi:plasmid stabilization system protein ParE
MNWRVEFRPEVEHDVAEAAAWYEARQPGLGAEFVEEIIRVWDALSENPLLNCRRHPARNIRWRYPDRFPYRVIYEVAESEKTVVVAAVLHAARHDRGWQSRV